jgi:hypothetical protein
MTNAAPQNHVPPIHQDQPVYHSLDTSSIAYGIPVAVSFDSDTQGDHKPSELDPWPVQHDKRLVHIVCTSVLLPKTCCFPLIIGWSELGWLRGSLVILLRTDGQRD